MPTRDFYQTVDNPPVAIMPDPITGEPPLLAQQVENQKPINTTPFHMSKEVKISVAVAVFVLLFYGCLAIFGANTIIALEKRQGKTPQVTVEKPISFIDTTYLKKVQN